MNGCVSDYFWPSRRFVCRPFYQCIKMLSVLFDSESEILNGKITTPNRPNEFAIEIRTCVHISMILCVVHCTFEYFEFNRVWKWWQAQGHKHEHKHRHKHRQEHET